MKTAIGLAFLLLALWVGVIAMMTIGPLRRGAGLPEPTGGIPAKLAGVASAAS